MTSIRAYNYASKANDVGSVRTKVEINEQTDKPLKEVANTYAEQFNAEQAKLSPPGEPISPKQVYNEIMGKLRDVPGFRENPGGVKLSVEDAHILFTADKVTDNNGYFNEDGKQHKYDRAQNYATSHNESEYTKSTTIKYTH